MAEPTRHPSCGAVEGTRGCEVSTIVNCSRRNFLKASVLAGGGLILGMHIPGLNGSAKAVEQWSSTFVPNAFLRIAKDGSVTVIGNHSEMGQGAYTSGAMMIAEELDADWTTIGVEPAPVDPAYNHPLYGVQITGGSTSTWCEWERLRKAGAAARQMLLTAAAQRWNVEPATCRTENGHVIHADSQRRLSYGELVEKASTLTPPQHVALKDPIDFKIIGKAVKRLDTLDKTNGTAVFGLDVTVPGMLVAVVARSRRQRPLRNEVHELSSAHKCSRREHATGPSCMASAAREHAHGLRRKNAD
jgi:isoquinoline 1-oxidoreductase beta subunit